MKPYFEKKSTDTLSGIPLEELILHHGVVTESGKVQDSSGNVYDPASLPGFERRLWWK